MDVCMPIPLSEIVIADGRREVDPAVVRRLADSIKEVGLQHPITVKEKGDEYILVAGRHRLEAVKRNGGEYIQATITKMSKRDARMWEIAENLHRSELTKLQRAEQVEEWRKLSAEQGGKVSSPQPHEHGVKKTAEALGVDPAAIRHAEKIAGITQEAKEAAQEAGIDDNQSKLLAVAKEPPERQVARVVELATHPLSDFESQEKQVAALMSAWNRAGKEARDEFLSRIEKPLMDQRCG